MDHKPPAWDPPSDTAVPPAESSAAPLVDAPVVDSPGPGIPVAGIPVIAIDSLVMQFGTHRALNELTMVVPPGVTGLVGANGAGKSTLMSILLGLQYATSGTVRVLGLDPHADGAEIRSHVGYAPERNVLPDDMAAFDYVRHLAEVKGLPSKEARSRASDSLWLAGLGEERFRLLGTMSTGQRQRVKLAQAVAASPRLVLLDEPTDGLDPMQRDSMLELIRAISTQFGISIMLSSHLLEEVERICDNVVALNAGRLVASGPLEELLSGSNRFRVECSPLTTEQQAQALTQIIGTDAIHAEIASYDPRLILIRSDLPLDQVARHCRDAVARQQVAIRSFGSDRNRLEDLFTDELVHS